MVAGPDVVVVYGCGARVRAVIGAGLAADKNIFRGILVDSTAPGDGCLHNFP